MSLPQQDQPHKETNNVGSAVADSDGDAAMVPSQTTTASPSLLDLSNREKAGLVGLFEKQDSFPLPDGYREVGVVFEGLTVHGTARGNRRVESFEIAILKMVDVYSFAKRIFNWHTGPTRPIISEFYGVVPEGETMLVLGRPGAGCSTLLRILANVREPFVKVDGNVSYANISAADAKKYMDGEIIYNSEDDEHAAVLTVGQTLESLLALKQPQTVKSKTFPADYTARMLDMFGMSHVRDTWVGNAFVRGVSGGERKRVSLSEALITNPAIACWKGAIRGLDSSVALHYFKVAKELSRSTGMVNIISTYQTSQQAYDLMDRVVVIYSGQQIYSGRASEAEQYFVEMGYYKKPRQTTPDFMTSITSVTERRARPGFEGKVPKTPEDFALYFRNSSHFERLQKEIELYKARHAVATNGDAFRTSVKASKHPGTGQASAFRVNFGQQVAILCRRQLQLTNADRRTFASRITSNVLQATLVGAICYKPPDNANGSYAIGGALFFVILYYVIFALGEIPATIHSRPLLIKHRGLGYYHPAAYTIAQLVTDIPTYVLQTLLFSAIFYFLVGLNSGAQYFFTFFFIIFTLYMTVACMYRMISSWTPNLSVALRYGCMALSVVLSTAGFVLSPPRQLGWSAWLRRASPASWAFEALMANEFRTRTLRCAADELIPRGPDYQDIQFQVCSIQGASPQSDTVSGDDYIRAVYGFQASHIWRNIGILWAFFAIYVLLVFLGSSLMVRETSDSTQKIFKKGAKVTAVPAEARIEGADDHANDNPPSDPSKLPTFTFQDVRYTVQVAGQDKALLNGITGVIRPGSLTALMGASGAGKTTLLETISGRKTTGKVEGSMLVDGRPLDSSFSRRAGFAMQADIHEPMSTVRECLHFSAILRQENTRSREERVQFAENIIHLLELESIADALIGTPGSDGLNVEERKRVTIGVELAADPAFLLFLDEPTSGLDSQASYEIVRFLKKIAASGLAVLCTIHQPSGDLFEMFDNVHLLMRGGKTVYAGPTGSHAKFVTEYFAERGCVCPADANPAEFILETVSPVEGTAVDWACLWEESAQAQQMLQSIANISSRKTLLSSGGEAQAGGKANQFATGFRVQFKELLARNARAQWRFGSYYLTQLVIQVYFGLFVGFYFFKITHTVNNMQFASLAILVAAQGLPCLTVDLACNMIDKFNIFLARERLGIYSWQALVTSLLVVAMPCLLVSYNLLFFCYYWALGMTGTAADGALSWLNWNVNAVFNSSFAMLLGAISPSALAVPYIISLVWNLFNNLSWALVVYKGLPSPFHYFFSWLSPLRYFYGSLFTATLGNVALECTEHDLVTFSPPSGQTCFEYATAFLDAAGGYLTNPDASADCRYCQSTSGADYIENLGYSNDSKWRDWGIFVVLNVSTIALVYFATWFFKIRPLYKK